MRNGRCQAFCSISSSTSSPSRNRIRTSATTARPWTKPERGSRSSTSRPPWPSTNPATTKAAVERQEAAPREAREQRARPSAARRTRRPAPAGSRRRRRRAARAEATLKGREEGSRNRRRARGRVPRCRRGGAAARADALRRAGRCAARQAAPAPPQPAPPAGGPAGGRARGAGGRPPRTGRSQETTAGAPSPCRASSTPKAVAAEYARPGAPLPAALHGPAHAARLPLADRVRERAPGRDRVPERAPAGRATSTRTRPSPSRRAGCGPAASNQLVVVVDSRKDPRLPEGWWNWGGIVRPVHLIPAGRAHLERPRDDVPGALPRAGDAAAAPSCSSTACCSAAAVAELASKLEVRAARAVGPRDASAPSGCRASGRAAARAACRCACRPRSSGSRRTRSSTRPGSSCATAARVQQVDRRRVGLRSVTVKRGLLYLNNRRIKLAGASIHEDMPGSGAALTRGRHGPHRGRPEGGRRERHALPLPAQRGAARPPRPGRDHGLEPGADLAARPPRQRPAPAAAAAARLGDRAPHGDRRAQPPVGDHPLGRERALVAPRRPARASRALYLATRRRSRATSTRRCRSRSTSTAAPTTPSSSPTTSSTCSGSTSTSAGTAGSRTSTTCRSTCRRCATSTPGLALVMTEFGAEARPERASAPGRA